MFSLARSRYTLPTQVAFAAANALGVLLSTIYNAATPDLYPGNAHHRIGWVATWVVGAQLLVSLLGRVAGAFGTRRKPSGPARPMGDEMRSFLPAVSTANMAEHLRRHNHEGRDRSKPPSSPTAAAGYRLSNDSGQGTEPNTESLQGGGRGRGSSSSSSSSASPPIEMHHLRKEEHDEVAQRHRYDEYDDEEDDDLVAIPGGVRGHSTDDERRRWGVGRGKVGGLVARLAGSISTRAWKILLLGYNIVDRTILPLGFIALTTGIVTYARFFVSPPPSCAVWLSYGLSNANAPAGGTRDLYRPRALDQGWCLLLARHWDPRPLVWFFW